MLIIRLAAFILIGSFLLFAQTPIFTSLPTLSRSGSGWQVEFTLDRYTDVTVAIVRPADAAVIRRLAGGLLGPNAPAPLLKDSLHQVIAWDGNDDFEQPVQATDSLKVRVRAGMSVQLAALVGDNPSSFSNASGGSIKGIVVGNDGSVYVCGMPGHIFQMHYGEAFLTVRRFDRNGNYVKTVFPSPANLSASQVRGWAVSTWPDGSWSPRASMTSIPGLSRTLLSPTYQPTGSSLLMMNDDNKLVFGAHAGIFAFGTDGSLPDSGTAPLLAKTPSMPRQFLGGADNSGMLGMTFVTPIRNTDKAYLSGMFNGIMSNGNLTMAPDTNFYRDGQVFKVDLATGHVEAWLALDTAEVPKLTAARIAKLGGGLFTASLEGTAIDAAGRVYVCDRVHKRVGVYDSNATLLGSMPIACPERVAVSGKSGAVYVATRYQQGVGSKEGYVRLHKFAPFDQGGAKICSVIVSGAAAVFSSLAINDSNPQPWIWIGADGISVKAYQDDGTALTLKKDFFENGKNLLQEYDRLALDRKSGTLFINDYQWGLYKIEDWNNPKAIPCSTTTGRLYGTDVTVGPNNLLYVHEGKAQNFSGPITRYTMDRLHKPAPWANTNSNVLTPGNNTNTYIKWGGGTADRGLAVANDGRVAVMGGGNACKVYVHADSGHGLTTPWDVIQVSKFPGSNGGVRYDAKGNLYVGAVMRSAEHQTPLNFLGDKGYQSAVGSIIRFNGTDTGSISAATAPGASKVYSLAGLGAFSNDPYPSGGCICHSPRFDVDLYGRLFVPNAITNQVSLLDNEGNLLLQFGKYGNTDSRGGLSGPGSLIPSPDIPLGWPASAVASEDWIYVSDFVNCRIARIKMNYALDNLPITEPVDADRKSAAWRSLPFALTSGPVPFSQNATISFALPGFAHVSLEVMDIRGRLVKKLAEGHFAAGLNKVVWDGTNQSRLPAAPGLYIYRLNTGNNTLTARTIIAR